MIKFVKNNYFILCLSSFVIVSAFTLMIVSQNVYERQKIVRALSQDIYQAEWDIKSLEAELSYLSRPERVEQITSAMTMQKANNNPIITQKTDSIVFTPTSLHLSAPIIPVSKPNRKRTVTKAKPANAVQKTNDPIRSKEPPKKVTQNKKDFNTLLDSIGGTP